MIELIRLPLENAPRMRAHASAHGVYALNLFIARPFACIITDQHNLRIHSRPLGDPLHYTASSKPIIIATKAMILQKHAPKSGIPISKQRLIDGKGIHLRIEKRNPCWTMLLVKTNPPLENVQFPERTRTPATMSIKRLKPTSFLFGGQILGLILQLTNDLTLDPK